MTIKATRRQALGLLLEGAGVAAAAGAGLTAFVGTAKSKGFEPLPPGADEAFYDKCIRCGLCVKACPYDTLKLAKLAAKVPYGTPYFEPRKIPCYMCEDIPCVKVCPSGALDRKLDSIRKARMGILLPRLSASKRGAALKAPSARIEQTCRLRARDQSRSLHRLRVVRLRVSDTDAGHQHH